MRKILFTGIALALLPFHVAAVEFSPEQASVITKVVGTILDQAHYRKLRLDDEISARHLDNYLNSFDYLHLFFLQSDVDEFERAYKNELDDRTKAADSSAGFVIFKRFLMRLEESNKRVKKLLAGEFDFSKVEDYLAARHEERWPKDKKEADEFWRLRIKYEVLQGKLASSDSVEKIKELIGKRYDRTLRSYRKFNSSEILEIYLSALGRAFDPHSIYMAPDAAENFDIHNVKLQLTGIGAVLQEDEGYTRIKQLSPGGPAARSKKIHPDDRIVGVAQSDGDYVDIVEMKLNDVVQLIRGEKGTVVRLTIIPAGKDDSVHEEISLVRDVIKLQDQFARAYVIENSEVKGKARRFGVIDLPQFYEGCASDVEKLMARMGKENVEGMILDLRRNGGGLLNEAVDLTGLFITKGPVVQVQDHRRRKFVLEDEDDRLVYNGPLMVMVGRYSASASEIVAAALQDYGRAVIVGDNHTHGKGTVQTLLPLDRWLDKELVSDPGRLKFTIQKFYRVAGGTTQKDGVKPDIILPNVLNHYESGEAYLPNVMPADKIPPVKYAGVARVEPFLNRLLKNTRNRVEKDKDFGYIHEDIGRFKQLQADKRVSLNEDKRRLEKKEIEKQKKSRDTERESRVQGTEKASIVKFKREQGKEEILYLPLERKPKVKPETPETAKDSSKKPKKSDEDDGDEPDVETSALPDLDDLVRDPHLRESLHILADYIDMLSASKLAGTAEGAKAPQN